ncbi:MAG: hypothetical protein CEE38_18740 [Planctomycetes bacterium B3_Pla]|nr:MAG: hypothetical protein CEE38_18740 [Planctomycetes bacterium B3_Pla]
MPRTKKAGTTVKKKKKKSTARRARKQYSILEAENQEANKMIEIDETIVALQSGPAGMGESEVQIDDFADVSEERASIISIVKGLEGQVETAFELKDLLEAELDNVRGKLAEESEARAELEVQVESLEAGSALVEQLRADISFAEDERNKLHRLLSEAQPQLEEVTVERDSVVDKLDLTEERTRELEGEKIALEAQVLNLKDKITDTDSLRQEFAEVTEEHKHSCKQVHDLTKSLEVSESSKTTFEKEQTATQKEMQALRKQMDQLREQVTDSRTQSSELSMQLEDQQATNQELMESNSRLENEVQLVNNKYEVTKGELDAFKNALRDIRSEATRTSGRVRQRYFDK